MSNISKFGLASALVAAATLLACSDSTSPHDPATPTPGFTAQVTGGAALQLAGRATFSPDVDGDDFGLAFLLVNPISSTVTSIRHGVLIYGTTPGTPALGEYPVVARDFPANTFGAAIVIDSDNADPITCDASTGTVRITSTSAERIRGTFSIHASCAHVSGAPLSTPVDAVGTFDAIPGTIPESGGPQPLPIVGSFVLAGADALPLPATVFDDVFPASEQSPATRVRIVATSGTFSVDATGHYEQRTIHDVFLDEVASVPLRGSDHGECTVVLNGLHCESSFRQGVQFTVTRNGPSIEMTQDLANEGKPATYRYARAVAAREP